MRFVYVGLAGALGALARYGINEVVGPRSLPWATLGINLTGSFALGAVLTVAVQRGWSPEAVAGIGVGFLGAYTTFSTFTWETYTLGEEGRMLAAVAYALGSVALGVLAAWAGYAAARALV